MATGSGGGRSRGVVAAGHPATLEAARVVLEAGGNAFDAAIAAAWAACVAEPVLVSLGGGGFLMASRRSDSPVLLDFFTHTPRHRGPLSELDFFPIQADFGGALQEFHIGLGAMAVPGMVRGLFELHRRLGSVPMRELVQPAVSLARDGLAMNAFQAYIFQVVSPIYLHGASSRAVFGSSRVPGRLAQEGELLRQPALADTLELLAIEGDDLFYRGEIAAIIAAACSQSGGRLDVEDLRGYAVELRHPLQVDYRSARLWLNPSPSTGGILIAFALGLLQELPNTAVWGDGDALVRMARVMALTNQARQDGLDGSAHENQVAAAFLAPERMARYLPGMDAGARPLGSTTQISVMDGDGNLASLTASNGEGCGYMVPGTGVMMNNMLGEEDLNPQGFHRWREGVRMPSMMAPTLMRAGDLTLATGSGGSNRIRSAVLQVLVKLTDCGMDLEQAVNSPRIHLEGGLLSIEGGFEPKAIEALRAVFSRAEVWQESNLFFGGAHSVAYNARLDRFSGTGDRRRGGVSAVLGP